MKIVVLSCDKNSDLFEPFHHCMEKYWQNHPEIIYATETITNPFYKTISYDYPLNLWTRRVRDTLNQIDDNHILLLVDDIFIRNPVDVPRLNYVDSQLKGNIALFNFEKSWDKNDLETAVKGFKKRRHGSKYEVSIMCGLWDKEKLINVLSVDGTPWDVEYGQNNCGYEYYINSGDYIIDWGYKTWNPPGVFRGKWCREVIPFFEKEGIIVDYSKRDFYD